MRKIADLWIHSSALPVTAAELVAWQAHYRLTLPTILVQLYKTQNGGAFIGQYPFELLPLLPPSSKGERICSLSDLAAEGRYLDDEGLEGVVEALGDPHKVIALAFDGAYCMALNYNADTEPTVNMLDLGGNFMFADFEVLYRTFDDFVQAVLESR